MTDDIGVSLKEAESEYDDILQQLDLLLRKHRGESPVLPDLDEDATIPVLTEIIDAAMAQFMPVQPVGAAEIPTLSEKAFDEAGYRETRPPRLDIALMLRQILDAVLEDARVDLAPDVRNTLVRELKRQLFDV